MSARKERRALRFHGLLRGALELQRALGQAARRSCSPPRDAAGSARCIARRSDRSGRSPRSLLLCAQSVGDSATRAGYGDLMAIHPWPAVDEEHRWTIELMEELPENKTQNPEGGCSYRKLRSDAESTDIKGYRDAWPAVADRYEELAASRLSRWVLRTRADHEVAPRSDAGGPEVRGTQVRRVRARRRSSGRGAGSAQAGGFDTVGSGDSIDRGYNGRHGRSSLA